MRLLHVADLHLDRPFEGITEFPVSLSKRVENTNQKVWQNIVDLAINQKADVLVLAGDTFHQAQVSLKMQRIFMEGLQRLANEEIATVICFGNHDHYQENKFWFAFPEKTIVFTEEEVTTKVLQLANGETVSFSSFSYQGPWIKAGKCLEFPYSSSTTTYHVGVYHGEVGVTNNFAPFQPSDLQIKGYDYWALGHIHKGDQLFDHGYYAGTPQGHSIKERTGTGVLLVDINQGNTQVEHYDVSEITWRQAEISLAGVVALQDLADYVAAEFTSYVSKPQFLKVVFTDYQHLGPEFLQKVRNEELLYFLREKLAGDTHEQVFLIQLLLSEQMAEDQKILLPEELVEQSMAVYQNETIFREVVQDLFEMPEMTQIIDSRRFQEQVLKETQKRIKNQLES